MDRDRDPQMGATETKERQTVSDGGPETQKPEQEPY